MPALLQDGDFAFYGGLDSATPPDLLASGQWAWAENLAIIDGRLQARPGFSLRVVLPEGKPQGLFVYPARFRPPSLIAVISGRAYLVPYPYQEVHAIPGEVLSETAEIVHGQVAVQVVEVQGDGSLKLIRPRYLLMLQDGVSPAAYYDGQQVVFVRGEFSTPQGTHMAWAGNRLWVAQQEKLFASDIGNPLSFREQSYNTLGGLTYFLLPGNCTGLAVLPGQSQSIKSPLLAFTDSTTTLLRANVLNRELWLTLEDFQSLIFPTVGCVAPGSIVSANGLLWWFAEHGLTRIDAARFSQESGQLRYMDAEMVRAFPVGRQWARAVSANVKNWLLFSVPHSGVGNDHTWLLDLAPLGRLSGSANPVWVSVWTGLQVVQWASVTWRGSQRLFALVRGQDGIPRIYEGLGPPGRDDGVDFPWVLETRGFSSQTAGIKRFRFAEIHLGGIRGNLTGKVSWAGVNRGTWKTLTEFDFKAAEGNILAGRPMTELKAWAPQERRFRTPDVISMDLPAGDPDGAEGPRNTLDTSIESEDTAFQLRLEGSGRVEFLRLRVFMEALREETFGAPVEKDPNPVVVGLDGGSETDLEQGFWEAESSARAQWRNWAGAASAKVQSWACQADAEKRARQLARARAEWILRRIAHPYRREIEIS